MAKYVFDTCCCCIELRSGCLIIAYMNLIAEILLIALGVVGLAAGSVIASDKKDGHEEAGIGILVISVVLLLVVFFLLAFTIVLLVGLHQHKRGHIKAYLIYGLIFLVISVIVFFASFAGPIHAENVVKNILTILIHTYFLMVIRSYYYKMDDKRPAVYNTA